MEENSAHPRNPDLTQRKTAQACAGIVNSFVLWACLHHAQTFLYALQPLWMLMVIPLWLVDFVWVRWAWRQKMVPLVTVATSHWPKVMMHAWKQQNFPKMNTHKTECVGEGPYWYLLLLEPQDLPVPAIFAFSLPPMFSNATCDYDEIRRVWWLECVRIVKDMCVTVGCVCVRPRRT